MPSDPTRFGRQTFHGPNEKRQDGQGDNQPVAQADPPADFGGAGGALEIVRQAPSPNVFALGRGICNAIDFGPRLPLPAGRTRRQPLIQQPA